MSKCEAKLNGYLFLSLTGRCRLAKYHVIRDWSVIDGLHGSDASARTHRILEIIRISGCLCIFYKCLLLFCLIYRHALWWFVRLLVKHFAVETDIRKFTDKCVFVQW